MEIRKMEDKDWNEVKEIYLEGMQTKNATFHSHVPNFDDWNLAHLKECRFVSVDNGVITGFIVLSRINNRDSYKGVCEISIYIAQKYRGQKMGFNLLQTLIEESRKEGIWTLQSVIIDENIASMKLHTKCGFRIVGYREKIAKDKEGKWHNTFLVERRNDIL